MNIYFSIFCLLGQLFLSAATPIIIAPKIIGGEDAADAEFPFQVSIEVMGGMGARTDVCSGVLFNASIVISSAICVQGALHFGGGNNLLRVLAGTSDFSSFTGNEQAIYVDEITSHPNFDEVTGDFDIAYLKLRDPFQLNDRVQSVVLARQDFEPSGQILTLGWGNHDPDWTTTINQDDAKNVKKIDGNQRAHNWTSILQKTYLQVIDNLDQCRSELNGVDNGRVVSENDFCAAVTNGKGICARDGGGPALCLDENDQLIFCGITSWSVNCAEGKYPVVYTNFGKFRQWIDTELGSQN